MNQADLENRDEIFETLENLRMDLEYSEEIDAFYNPLEFRKRKATQILDFLNYEYYTISHSDDFAIIKKLLKRYLLWNDKFLKYDH